MRSTGYGVLFGAAGSETRPRWRLRNIVNVHSVTDLFTLK